jgi:hypothetical protein
MDEGREKMSKIQRNLAVGGVEHNTHTQAFRHKSEFFIIISDDSDRFD